MTRTIKYVFYDVLRTRFVAVYALFLFVSTYALFQLDSDPGKVVLSLLNILLMVVPLVSVVFTTIHFYNSYEFIELLLAQPIRRRFIFLAEYLSVALSLSLAFLVGVGLPCVLFGSDKSMVALLFSGVALTFVFVSLAFLSAVLTRDKARAVGVALLFWFYFSLLYDGLLLWAMYTFGDYPMEKVTLALIALNPIDLARIVMLLQLDIAALMGYTGAFYREFFGTVAGSSFAVINLLLWILLPLWMALKIFCKKDL